MVCKIVFGSNSPIFGRNYREEKKWRKLVNAKRFAFQTNTQKKIFGYFQVSHFCQSFLNTSKDKKFKLCKSIFRSLDAEPRKSTECNWE